MDLALPGGGNRDEKGTESQCREPLFDYDDVKQIELDANRLSWSLNSCCRLAKTQRDAGGWLTMSDLISNVRHWAPWVERAYMHCLPELIMVLASRMDDKMGRFQVACPHMTGIKRGEEVDWIPSCDPPPTLLPRFDSEPRTIAAWKRWDPSGSSGTLRGTSTRRLSGRIASCPE